MAHGSLASLLLLLAASAQGAAAFGGKSATGVRSVVPNSYILQVNASAPALAKRGVSVFEVRLLPSSSLNKDRFDNV